MKRTTIIVLVITILFVITCTGCNSKNTSIVEATIKEEIVDIEETGVTSSETGIPTYTNDWLWGGEQLSPEHPEVDGPSGTETFFNEDVSSMVENMKGYTYWVRDDGIRMLDKYIICKAKLEETATHRYSPIGKIIHTTVGLCIICSNDTEKDVEIAVTW